MQRGRSGSLDLFAENSHLSPGRGGGGGSPLSHGGRSDGGGSRGGGGGGVEGGGMGALEDESTRQKVLHAERMRIALANMSEGQRERFEFFRRSHFHRETMKRLMLESF